MILVRFDSLDHLIIKKYTPMILFWFSQYTHFLPRGITKVLIFPYDTIFIPSLSLWCTLENGDILMILSILPNDNHMIPVSASATASPPFYRQHLKCEVGSRAAERVKVVWVFISYFVVLLQTREHSYCVLLILLPANGGIAIVFPWEFISDIRQQVKVNRQHVAPSLIIYWKDVMQSR